MSFIPTLQAHTRLYHLSDMHLHQIKETLKPWIDLKCHKWNHFTSSWFLVLPLVTEKIDLSLRLRCVVIKKGPKYLMWYEFLCTGRGYTLAARMWFVRNNLSIVSWFIYEVCSLKHFSAVICLKCAILKNLEK